MLVPVELSLSLVPSLHAVVPPAPSCASSSARSNPSSSSRHLCFPPHPPASCKLPCPGGWCSPTSSDLHQARACLRSFIATSRRSARPGSIAPSPLAGARRPAPAPCSPLPMPRAPLVVRARSCELRLAAPPVPWSWWCGVATSRQPSWPRSSPRNRIRPAMASSNCEAPSSYSGIGFRHRVHGRFCGQFLHASNLCCSPCVCSLLIHRVSACSRLPSSRRTRHPLLDSQANSLICVLLAVDSRHHQPTFPCAHLHRPCLITCVRYRSRRRFVHHQKIESVG
jgi:hypothetical protein